MNVKKRILICTSILFAGLLFIVIFAGHNQKIVGYDGLIEKAREEISVYGADSIDLMIAGESVIDDRHLFWFVSGNEYQAHRYFPIEFVELDSDEYKFVKKYSSIERGTDIFVLMWDYGYSLIVNNPKCQSISISGSMGEENIPVEKTPFVYYYKGMPSEYSFLDKDGNTLN